MGRRARQLSSSGFYHIVFRGVNHQHIFEDKSDYTCFLKALRDLKIDLTFEMYAYYLISNTEGRFLCVIANKPMICQNRPSVFSAVFFQDDLHAPDGKIAAVGAGVSGDEDQGGGTVSLVMAKRGR